MKKTASALGGLLLLLLLLLLPSASAHRNPATKKLPAPRAAENAAADLSRTPASPRAQSGEARGARRPSRTPRPKPAMVRRDPLPKGPSGPGRLGRARYSSTRRARALSRTRAEGDELTTGAGEQVAPAEYNGDVRDLPQVPVTPMSEVELMPPPRTMVRPSRNARSQAEPNVALAPAPAPVLSFEGLGLTTSVTGGFAGAGYPPDINGEVGLNHYIQAVNSSYAIYSKTGTLLAAFTENALWAGAGSTPCSNSNQGDPVVVYDQFADRWILSNFAFLRDSNNEEVSPFYQCFAISKTSDPVRGGWWLYALRMDTGVGSFPPVGTFNDYAKFGNWNDGCLYMSANGFLNGRGSGMIFASLNKSDMESGLSLTWGLGFLSLSNAGPAFSMVPSHISGARDPASLPAAGTPNYFVSETLTSQAAFDVRKFTPGARCGGGGNLSGPTNVGHAGYFPPNDGTQSSSRGSIVPQPFTSTMLDTVDDRVMQKVQYRRLGSAESLWVNHTVRTSDSFGTTGIQWAQLNVSGGTVSTTPVQQQIYKPDSTTYRWMGSIAADHAGNVALGYSLSGPSLFPGIAVSGRLVTDPLNNLPQTETLYVAGGGSQIGISRWGDYTAMSVDPADDCTFWYTNQYYGDQFGGSNDFWQTRVTAFRFPGCSSSSCTFSISPSSNSVGAAATTGAVTVTAGAGCSWTATSNAPWLVVPAGFSGSGNGTLTYSVSANTAGAPRTGTITVAGQTHTVTQAGGTCATASAIGVGQTLSGTLSTTDCSSAFRSGSFADRYTFNGTAGQQVAVLMSSAAFDTYVFLIAPNGTVIASDDDGGGGTNSRVPFASGFFSLPAAGTYTIETTSFFANTAGGYVLSLQVPCSFTVSPASQTFGAAGGTGTVSVTTGAGCGWSALSGSGFLGVTAGSTGTGSGTVSYTVGANPNASTRTGTLTVAGQTFTVTQAANSVQLSAASFSANESALKVLVNVTRTGSTAAAASVSYATADGTADRRKDYTQTLGTLVFAPGEATKAVTVFITDDVFQEATETFSFTLSNAAGTTLGSPSAATVSIVSNDAATGPNPVDAASFNGPFYVGQHYVDFLNREADASGLSFWTGQTTGCGSPDLLVCRINVSAAFFQSIEFQNTGYIVYLFYKSAYGDATSPNVAGTVPVIRLDEFLPDTQRIGQGLIVGQGAWQAQLEANKQAYALEFVQRSRFLTAYPLTLTPAQFVDRLRLNTGAALSPSEINSLVAQLTANNTSAGRAAVLRAVAEDGDLQQFEKNRAFVLMQYYGYLRRNPNDAPEPTLNFAGWKFWLDKLNQFNGNFVAAEMVKAFIQSDEYRKRFGN